MQVHRCRFVDIVPESVEALAFSPDGSTLAVGRAQGDIELYSSSGTNNDAACWFRAKEIAGFGKNTVRTLAWARCVFPSVRRCRLFSAGLAGSIVEWSPHSLCRVRETPSCGGAVWGIATSPNGCTLAAACEDGCVRLFALVDDEDIAGLSSSPECLSLLASLPRRKDRLTCVCWSADGSTVFAAGASGIVAGWSVASRRSVFSATLDVLSASPTVAWGVACLEDGSTLVTGDSQGKVIFWDIATATQLQVFKEHQSDVLAVVAAPAGDTVFAAGIDSKLCMFQQVEGNRWMCRGGIRRHTHDVKALAMHCGTLVSGGVDTQLAVFTTESFSMGKAQCLISPFACHAGCALCSSASCAKQLVARNGAHSLQVWRLGKPASPPYAGTRNGSCLSLASQHTHLFDFDLAKARSSLTTTALSDKGNFLACSDIAALRVFAINHDDDDDRISLAKLVLPTNTNGAYRVAFAPDERLLAYSAFDGSITLLSLDSDNHRSAFVASFPNSGNGVEGQPDIVFALSISPDSQRLAALTASNCVRVFDLVTFQELGTVPPLDGQFTAAAFSADSRLLVLATTSSRYHIWDLAIRSLTPFSRQLNSQTLPPLHVQDDFPVGIAINPLEPTAAYLHGLTWICRIELEASRHPSPSTLVKRYHLVLAADFVGDDELAVVERPWVNVLQKLPEPLSLNRFGF